MRRYFICTECSNGTLEKSGWGHLVKDMNFVKDTNKKALDSKYLQMLG